MTTATYFEQFLQSNQTATEFFKANQTTNTPYPWVLEAAKQIVKKYNCSLDEARKGAHKQEYIALKNELEKTMSI